MRAPLGVALARTGSFRNFAETPLSAPRPAGCGACDAEPYPDVHALAEETALQLQQGSPHPSVGVMVELAVRTCHSTRVWSNVAEEYCAAARVVCGVFVHLSRRMNESGGGWQVVLQSVARAFGAARFGICLAKSRYEVCGTTADPDGAARDFRGFGLDFAMEELHGREECLQGWGFAPADVAANYERELFEQHRIQTLSRAQPPLAPPSGEAAVWLRAAPRQCPRAKVAAPTGTRPVRLACIAPIRLPEDWPKLHMLAHVATEGWCRLFLLVAHRAPERAWTIWEQDVVALNVPRWYASAMPFDDEGRYNTIYKTLWGIAIFATGELGEFDMLCRLDADTVFFPGNLVRHLEARDIDFDAPLALGSLNFVHKYLAGNVVFLEGGTGIYLTRGAVRALAPGLRRLRVIKDAEPVAEKCVALEGHADDVVLGSCFREAGVVFLDDADEYGRVLFVGSDWANASLPSPAELQPGVFRLALPVSLNTACEYVWRHRAWQFRPCLGVVQDWVSPHPVAVHASVEEGGLDWLFTHFSAPPV